MFRRALSCSVSPCKFLDLNGPNRLRAFYEMDRLFQPYPLRDSSPKRKKNRIYPYRERKIRSTKREPKLYLMDWSDIPFAYQVVWKAGIDSVHRGVRLIAADRFLVALV